MAGRTMDLTRIHDMALAWMARPFLSEYRSNARQTPRLERILAVGRTFLAVSALGAIYADPTEPSRFATLAYALLATYAAYSLTVLLSLAWALRRFPRLPRILHSIDIIWAVAITFFSAGPVSPFFLFFIFVLLAAAYRWGFRETLATAVVIIVIYCLETLVVAAGPWRRTWFAQITFDTTHVIARMTYLLLTGILLAYLAEQDKELRAEIAASADAVGQPRVELGVAGSVAAIATVFARAFRPARIVVIIHDQARNRTTLWLPPRAATVAGDISRVTPKRISDRQRSIWLFPTPTRAWYVPRIAGGNDSPGVALDPVSFAARRIDVPLPRRFIARRRFSSIAAVDLGLAGEWQGRILLFDPEAMPRGLQFFETLAEQITPVLSNVLLLRRLRLRAGAAERARVARELHDGAIQALIGIEMRTEALRRVAEREAPALTQEVTDIQECLRHEVISLRELMQQMQPVELDSAHQLPEVLEAVVDRFRKDTGIAASFVADGLTTPLPLRTSHEVVRIVQEGLVNVRKHSQARHVSVRLVEEAASVRLTIDDDGCGFGFEGRLSGAELSARRLGPTVIRQRARTIGATIAVETAPGAGSRVEVAFDV